MASFFLGRFGMVSFQGGVSPYPVFGNFSRNCSRPELPPKKVLGNRESVNRMALTVGCWLVRWVGLRKLRRQGMSPPKICSKIVCFTSEGFTYIPPLKTNMGLKRWFPIGISFSRGLFSVSGGVDTKGWNCSCFEHPHDNPTISSTQVYPNGRF